MIPVARQKPVPTNRVVLPCCRLHAAALLYSENWLLIKAKMRSYMAHRDYILSSV